MMRRIQCELRARGFDLCHPLDTSWYNDLLEDEGLIDDGSLSPLPEPRGTIPIVASPPAAAVVDDHGHDVVGSKQRWSVVAVARDVDFGPSRPTAGRTRIREIARHGEESIAEFRLGHEGGHRP